MRRSTGISAYLSPLRAAFASAIVLGVVLSCSDSSAPARTPELEPNFAVDVTVPDSVKQALRAAMALADENGASANISATPTIMVGPVASISAPATAAASFSASASPKPYTLAEVSFAPEPTPANVLSTLKDDGFFPFFVPIGFDFQFYGNVYDKLSIHYNGFVLFGPLPSGAQNFYLGDKIADLPNPNNIIALAWNDWQSQKAPGSIRYETRGEAPNRRFILQFTAVPEYGGNGKLTSQLVLSEGSNKVTIYTTSMTVTSGGSKVTQGIENSTGTEAMYDSVQQPVLKTWSPRVRNWFNLANDAIAFSPPAPNKPPVVFAPANIAVSLPQASCEPVAVEVGTATFTDDAPGASVVGVRGDGKQLSDPYPKGVTTIAWTATDAEGLKTTVNQTVTVSDNEKPSIAAPANMLAGNDPGLASAVVAVGTATAEDNCKEVAVASSRSDGADLSAPYPIGLTTIKWTASDPSGNSADATQTVTVVDVEAPVFGLGAQSNLEADATSPAGAVVTYAVNATDNVGVTSLSCAPASGSVFPIGSTPVSCTASDAAGNTSSKSFSVTVLSGHEQLPNLLEIVIGYNLPNGAAQPLINQLRTAYSEPGSGEATCKKLADFILLVEKKKSSISTVEAEFIIAEANRIMDALGCGEGSAKAGSLARITY
ncbi:MAG: HYR domain-containing protein [Gemmatimonadota bacterium]|nr:HYR domain-containing protein [Gemmatimonadota bacterium]